MAISLFSFTNASDGISVNASTGGTRILVYVGSTNSGSDSISAVSWNSESFTKSGSIQSGAARFISVWYLKPTGTGSNTFNVTGQGATSGLFVLTGVKQSTSPKSWSTATGTVDTTKALTITAVNGDWLVGGGISNVANLGVGANTTIRSTTASIIQVDSNGAASPTALNFTMDAGAYALAGLAIEPSLVYTIVAAQGTFTLTGIAAILKRVVTLVAVKGTYTLTGVSTTFTFVQKWFLQAKNSTSWTNGTKNSTSTTNQTKSSTSWTNTTKN